MKFIENPYHEGERRIQSIAGETDIADRNGVVISDKMIKGAWPFLAQQTFAIFAFEADERMQCSMLIATPGFMESLDGSLIHLDLNRLIQPADSRILQAANAGRNAGMLVIDLASRRRLRVNGRLERASATTLTLSIRETYPNCPKYITRRLVRWDSGPKPSTAAASSSGDILLSEQVAAIAAADLIFLASQHPQCGADASHRGGNPGFLRVLDSQTLAFNDYPGNGMYNTLGNLEVDNRIGLLLPDFTRGALLSATGTARTLWSMPKAAQTTLVNRKQTLIHIEQWSESHMPLLGAELLDFSPYNPQE